MKKVAKFSVHRNTKQQRNSKRIRKELIAAAKECAQLKDIDGFAVVAFAPQGELTAWEVKNGDTLLLPEKTKMAIAGTVHRQDYET